MSRTSTAPSRSIESISGSESMSFLTLRVDGGEHRCPVVAEQAVHDRGSVAADVAGQPVEHVGVDLVQGDSARRHGGVEAEHVVFADQMADLLGGAPALGAHPRLDRAARPRPPAAAIETAPPTADVGGGAEAEHPRSEE